MPIGDQFDYTLLEVWNSVAGKWKEDQEWSFHARFIAEYDKKPGFTYRAGVCFVMGGDFEDTLDCVQVEPGQATGDDIVFPLGDEDIGDGIWDSKVALPLDEISQSWVTEPVGFVNGEYLSDMKAVENCDE